MKKLGMEKVYDIKNIETHSFIANGFVVHNCGEQPLLPNEACNLGSINIAMMLKDGAINWDLLKETVYTATDFLDDVVDRSAFPLPEIEKQVKKNRKIGLGIMGWSDLLLLLGIPYCSDEAVDVGREVMEFIDYYSKERSMQLAVEKGSFPNFNQSIYKKVHFQEKVIG
jgi:Ribonucleotide reductase, alpha subunit